MVHPVVSKMITDASGKFHDISKEAFDTFGMTHQGKWDPDFSKLMDGGFNDGVKSILGKAGLAGKALQSWGESGWKDTVKQLLTSVGTEYTETLVAAGVAGAVGGPVGSALGVAIEVGALIGKATWESYKEKMSKHKSNFDSGQWVVIDNGMAPAIMGAHNVLDEIKWRRRMMGGRWPEMPIIGQGEGVPFEESMSTGFMIGEGEELGTVQVFNFLTSREETKKTNEVIGLDQDHAQTMDNNEIWSEVRLLYFKEAEQSRLEGSINTDPGAEVYLHGQACTVIKSNGPNVLVENKQTSVQHWTTSDELIPGRRVHNNTWNYTGEGRVPDSFDGVEASLYIGAFIWIGPTKRTHTKHRSTVRQLACVHELYGPDNVSVFTAVDGEWLTVSEADKDLRPVSDQLNEFLANSHEFTVFKDAVVRGQDVERLAAGKHRSVTLLCLGVTPLDDDTEARKSWRERASTYLEHKKLEELTGQLVGTADPLYEQVVREDLADETRALEGEPMVDTRGALALPDWDEPEPIPSSGSQGMLLTAAAAIGGVLLMIR